jgi:hypothetical protein
MTLAGRELGREIDMNRLIPFALVGSAALTMASVPQLMRLTSANEPVTHVEVPAARVAGTTATKTASATAATVATTAATGATTAATRERAGEVRGRCAEAEHANDPRCAGARRRPGPSTTMTTRDENDENEANEVRGPCDEPEHAHDPRCVNGDGRGGDDDSGGRPGGR